MAKRDKNEKQKQAEQKDFSLAKKTNLKDTTIKSVWGIILFVLSVFFLLASIHKGGKVGLITYDFLSGLLGYGY